GDGPGRGVRFLAGVDLAGVETPVVRHGRDATAPNPDLPSRLSIWWEESAAGDLGDRLLPGRDPGHHRPEFTTDLLDFVLFASGAQFIESLPTRTHLTHELFSEAAGGDVFEDPFHLGLRVLVHDPGARDE